jgi:hypothetical protein
MSEPYSGAPYGWSLMKPVYRPKPRNTMRNVPPPEKGTRS